MSELGKLLRERDIPFNHRDRRIMCFAHVINICCQHVVKQLTNIENLDDSHYSLAQARDGEVLDPISLGRNIVRGIRSSGQRRLNFEQTIEDGNQKGWFRVGNPPTALQIRRLQLLHDIKTRWDSIYFMIKRLREMRPVCYTHNLLSG
jgi:hypothetical protein